MKKACCVLSVGISLICSPLPGINPSSGNLKQIESVDFSHVKITDSFWSPRLERHVSVTLPVCIDQIENQTGRIRNFENAARGKGQHSGIFFDDSDVYKALEGMAYSLINNPNAELEKKADEWIDKFALAQQPDGYINTFFTLTGLDKRWTNMDKHEMYCAGHMTEAAVAYYKATGKRKFLDVCIRMVNHMMSVFGPGKRHWVPGHEEIELALVKLYGVTKDERYLNFANWLLEERGHGYGSKGGEGDWDPVYYQDNMPVREMKDIAGHAVRCMYLYCGMADVAALKQDNGYVDALNRLWDDVVLRNMYITGGIGSSSHNEGFTEDCDLPNKEAYCETCASVGMVLWNARMNQLTGDSKYVDILERSLYNGALAGISLHGDRFFYVNPLESDGTHHRKAWYGCACCPSQISRFLPSIGNYVYGVSEDAFWVNLFMGNTTSVPVNGSDFVICQETGYPWNGNVQIFLKKVPEKFGKSMRIRIPGWCKAYSVRVNGKKVQPKTIKGYINLTGSWKDRDKIQLSMEMPVEVISADPNVKADIGKRAVQRGPLVYCMEETDNKQTYSGAQLGKSTKYKTSFESDLLDGVVCVKAATSKGVLNLIPYYSWDNREAGKMKVWMDFKN